MEPRPLTTWEQKDRDGLLALESNEWREKRHIAEDPNTTADVLIQFGNALVTDSAPLLAEAVITHPNTPPAILCELLDVRNQLCFPAFCRNPITPFLALESPDFWLRLCDDHPVMCERLLGDAKLPLVVVKNLTPLSDEKIVQPAYLHIAIAGEMLSDAEGIATLRASEYAGYEADNSIHFYMLYLRDMAYLRNEGYAGGLYNRGISAHWIDRLYATFQLPTIDTPFTESAAGWNRSPLDLIDHLAHDGNRLVRWVAQKRLQDPNFVHRWYEEAMRRDGLLP